MKMLSTIKNQQFNPAQLSLLLKSMGYIGKNERISTLIVQAIVDYASNPLYANLVVEFVYN